VCRHAVSGLPARSEEHYWRQEALLKERSERGMLNWKGDSKVERRNREDMLSGSIFSKKSRAEVGARGEF
jgi:hypothetical protein